MQARARNDLARMFAEQLGEAGLRDGRDRRPFDAAAAGADRARGCRARREAIREEIKGPRTSAPAQALEGFLRKTGLTQDQLEERDGVLFRGRRPAGPGGRGGDRPRRSSGSSRDFPWPKSMRWGGGDAALGAAAARHRRAARRGDRAGRGRRRRQRRDDGRPPLPSSRADHHRRRRATTSRSCAPAT